MSDREVIEKDRGKSNSVGMVEDLVKRKREREGAEKKEWFKKAIKRRDLRKA